MYENMLTPALIAYLHLNNGNVKHKPLALHHCVE